MMSASSRGASSISAASTHRHDAASTYRRDAASTHRRDTTRHARCNIDTLSIGADFVGTVTGVRDFGAFLDIGAGKDGLLHAKEADEHGARVADMRDHVRVGQSMRVFVKTLDVVAGKFTLTVRNPARRPSAAAAAAMAAAAERERAARAAERERAIDHERECERVAALERVQAAERQRQREIEAAMVAAAEHREAQAAASREAAGLLLPAAELLRAGGQRLPPAPAAAPREILVSKELSGKRLVLYKMPWRTSSPAVA